MAGAKKSQKTIVDTWKKKRWHRIIAPDIFHEQLLGETPALEPNMLVGRTVSANLAYLTRDIKKQHVNVTFEVRAVKGDTAYTFVKKFEVSPSYIKKYVRRAKNRIDDSFACSTADNVLVMVKPFFITRNLTANSVCAALRKKAKECIIKHAAKLSYNTLVTEIVSFKLQRALRDALKNIYPLKTCEIRMMEIISGSAKAESGESAGDNSKKAKVDAIKAELPSEKKEDAALEAQPVSA